MTALTDGWVGRRRFDVLQSEESATNFILLEVYNSQDGELVTRRSTLRNPMEPHGTSIAHGLLPSAWCDRPRGTQGHATLHEVEVRVSHRRACEPFSYALTISAS